MIVALILTSAMSGCQKDVGETTVAARADDQAGQESHGKEEQKGDEHEHHHVHAPWYKPRSFADLVTSLETRMQKANPSARQRAQLIDIIGWIPELAADSDLRRKDFESAQMVSKMLLVEMSKSSSGNGSAATFEKHLATLRDLSNRSNLNPQAGTAEPSTADQP